MQTTAQPRHIMNQVLGVLQELNVRWKKIGHYNMKCLWLHTVRGSDSLGTNHVNDLNYLANDTTMTANAIQPQITVKFEMQVFSFPMSLSSVVCKKFYSYFPIDQCVYYNDGGLGDSIQLHITNVTIYRPYRNFLSQQLAVHGRRFLPSWFL